MLPEATIWNILQAHVPHGQWISMSEIFAIVQLHGKFDSGDLEAYRRNTLTPAWRVRVKRILDKKKKAGKIQGRKRT
jgi:hypothetical protein